MRWLRKLFRRPARARANARTYDTREGFWGNSVQWFDAATRRVYGHCEPRPVCGDVLKSAMASGRVGLFVFIDVEWMRDPPDMFFGTVEQVGYEEPVVGQGLGKEP